MRLTDSLAFNPGSDYYADVRVTRQGEPCATFLWSDQKGQESRQSVNALLSSMRWVSPEALEFDTWDGKTIRLWLSNDLYFSARSSRRYSRGLSPVARRNAYEKFEGEENPVI